MGCALLNLPPITSKASALAVKSPLVGAPDSGLWLRELAISVDDG